MKEGEAKKRLHMKKDHFHNKAREDCFSSLKLFGSGAKYQGGIKEGRPLSELQTQGATDVGETEGQQ